MVQEVRGDGVYIMFRRNVFLTKGCIYKCNIRELKRQGLNLNYIERLRAGKEMIN